MMKIKLSKGFYALVDDEDYDFLNQWKWHVQVTDKKAYALRSECKRMIIDNEIWVNTSVVRMHRILMNLTDKNLVVDHINGDGLDNRKSNLRICTDLENKRNVKRNGTSTSRFKGISKRSKSTWHASININKKPISLGVFKTEEDAAMAYNIAAKKHFGEFANLNVLTIPDFIPKRVRFVKQKGLLSKYKGVTFQRVSNSWVSCIVVNRKRIHIGTFDNEIDAAIAYNKKALEYRLSTEINDVADRPTEGRRFKKSTSLKKGVSLFTKTGKWSARFTLNGKRISLGHHKTEQEASAAIDNFVSSLN